MSLAAPTVPVGPYRLVDLDRHELVAAIADLAAGTVGSRPAAVFACHVGGLNERRNPDFVAAMTAADLVYADGVSVVSLMKLAGAQRVQRHPTTDLGWEVFDALAERLDRPVRVALLGGPEGLADRAGEVVGRRPGVTVVATEHGYHSDWEPVLARLRSAEPDLVVVGLGMPAEALWTIQHRDALPPAAILTAGGWFGYIVGEEKRAPAWMRSAGLEWMARIAQSPRRLWKRYAGGALTTAAMAPGAARSGRRGRRRSRAAP
jgi:exopolysaccharide biosynthesis WecB/TagA/CpsF family protein